MSRIPPLPSEEDHKEEVYLQRDALTSRSLYLSDRVPTQGDGAWWTHKKGTHPPGTVSKEEFLGAWEFYCRKYGRDFTLERMIERGGFSYYELTIFLGHPPTTWKPNG